jgi:hypothetical protein
MKGNWKQIGLALVGLIVAGTGQAYAQDPSKFEVTGGYQYLRGEDERLNKGWFGDFVFNGKNGVGLVVQGSGQNGDQGSILNGLIGARLSSFKNAKVVPYGQVLAGVVNYKVDALGTFMGFTSIKTVDSTSREFNFQVGGGVHFYPTPKVGIRVAADFLQVFHAASGTNFLRLSTGVVIPFGSR